MGQLLWGMMDSTTRQVFENAQRVERREGPRPPAEEEDAQVTEIQQAIAGGPTGQPDTASMTNGNVEPAVKNEESDDWETNKGTVRGGVVVWQPSHQLDPPSSTDVELADDQIAISASAIETCRMPDTTFSFAKTLHTPYMGAGVVDIPPGGEKRPKNTRTMQMVFFVHCGKVSVTVNETKFRISAGGIWTVPRGNYYGIENDGEGPARIFFSQACEAMPETM